MLDEHAEKDRCIARLKNAYALGLHGDDPSVLDGSAEGRLRQEHRDTGVSADDGDAHEGVRSEKEVAEEKGKRKRQKEGTGSLDGHFKPVSKGKGESEAGKPVSKKAKREEGDEAEHGQGDEQDVRKDEKPGAHGKGKHGREVSDEEEGGEVKETVQADSEHGARHQKSEQGDSGRKARNLRTSGR